MKRFVIGYDLNRPRGEADYPDLIRRIKQLCPINWHSLDSTWIVQSDQTSVALRDSLQSCVDTGDEILVAELTGAAAWSGIASGESERLRNILVT